MNNSPRKRSTPSISRYLNVQIATFPGFTAQGDQVTFLCDLSGLPQVWRVPAAPGQHPWWPEQLTFGQNRVMGAWPSPADRGQLVFARDAGGNENAALFLLEPGSSEARNLTAGYEEAMHIFGCWARDGNAIYFAANRRHPVHFDIYRYTFATQETELIWQHDQPGYLFRFGLSPDGQTLAFVRVAASFTHDLFLLELDSGDVRQLSPDDKPARYEGLAYGQRALYVITDLDSDFLHLRRLQLATGEWEMMVTPNWDLEALAISPDGRYLAYTVNVEGGSRLELVDLATSMLRPGPDLPGASEGIAGVIAPYDQRLAFAPDNQRLAFSYSSATSTSDVYIWDFAEDTVYPVTKAGHGGLSRETFVAPELVHYPTFDERKIPAWLYTPEEADAEKLPVVVFVHGGPESQSRPQFVPLIQYLVQSGYAVLVPNVRGSTGYGKAYSHLDDVEKRMDSVADLAYAVHWLDEQPGLDEERVAVYGGSYGGFMVLAALTSYPELWAAGVDIVGISNLATFLENTSDYRRGHRESEYGSLEEDREFLERIAPINKVDQIQAPLMVIHGANDPRVPLSEAEQLVSALEARDVPVRFLVFDDEGHGIIKLANKLVAYPAVVEFLDQYLG